MDTKPKDYWALRSEQFDQLIIPGHKSVVDAIIKFGRFGGDEKVLDIGAGNGAVTNAIAPLVKFMIGMDISPSMLETSTWHENIIPMVGDIRQSHFLSNTFDNIIASYVLHHTGRNILNVTKECNRILKNGGEMIIVFPVPPHDDLKEEFATLFSFKDDRIVLLPSEILNLLRTAEFINLKHEFLSITIDIVDWLDNSMLSPYSYRMMLDFHLDASELFKKSYNMRQVNDRYLIDTKVMVVGGAK